MPADISFLVTGGAMRGPLFGQLMADDESGLEHLQPGRMLGPFRLLRRIGAGGSSIVFQAERCEGFEQTVAIKVLRSQEHLRERFRLERGFLGRLEHPGIARIIDGGESEDGVLWSAMEYIEGESITAYCNRIGADWSLRLQLVARICDALQFAHRHLVVHGDIKPANILVDRQGEPRLLDFGISSSYTDADGARGSNAFTPGYASPEQVSGERLTLASDVFQIGRLLSALVPDALPVPRLARLNLRALIERALAEQPGDRIESVAQLRNDLNRIRENQPCRARRWSLWQRVQFFTRSHWRALTIAAAVVLALVGSGAYYTARIRAERDRAELEARAARVTSDFLQNMFRMASPSEGRTTTVVDILDQSARRLMSVIATAPMDRAVLVESLASANLELDRYDAASEILTRYTENVLLDESVPAALRARLLLLQARVEIKAGRSSTATELIEQAVKFLPQLRTSDADAIRLTASRVRAQIWRSTGRMADAQRTLEAALQRQNGSASLETAGAQIDLASIYSIISRPSDAIATLRQATQALHELLGGEAPLTLETQRKLAFYLAEDGNVDEAEQLLNQQDKLIRESFGAQSMEYASLIGQRAVIAYSVNDYVRAITYYSQQLELLRLNGIGESYAASSAHHNLASALAMSGQVDEAIEELREALRLREQSLSAREQVVLVNRFDLSLALCMNRDWNESQQLFENALKLYREVFGRNSIDESVFVQDRAECLIDGGRAPFAATLLGEAVTPEQWASLPEVNRKNLGKLFNRVGLPTPETRQ